MPIDDRILFTERRLAMPRERVWQACADPAQLARGWRPDGFTNAFEPIDLHPDGDWRFRTIGPDGRNIVYQGGKVP